MRKNCRPRYVVEGRVEGTIESTGRRERRRKHLRDDLMEKRVYWKLKGGALDGTCVELALEGVMELYTKFTTPVEYTLKVSKVGN